MHIVEVVALIIMMSVVNNWTEALFYLWNWPLTRQFNQLVSRYVEEHLKLKFGYSEKATKFEKIFHLKFDATQQLGGRNTFVYVLTIPQI